MSGTAQGMPMASAGTGAAAVGSNGSSGSSGSVAAAQQPVTGAAGGGAGAPATMAAAGASGGAAAMSAGPSMGTLTFKFTTKSYGGFYGPLNYVAVWFESKDGKFIKTVARWAGAAHASDLSAWTKASGGWGGLFGGMGNTADMMDAMSSATLRQHQAHSVMWNMKGTDKMVVPDGDYVAVVEVTEDRGTSPGPVLRVPFKKGPEPQMVDPADEMAFTGISLSYQP
jgi:hypothetical protein